MFTQSNIRTFIEAINKAVDGLGVETSDSFKEGITNLLNQGLESYFESKDNIAYTIKKEDHQKILSFTVGTVVTIDKDLPQNFECCVEQGGDDALSFQAAAGVTLNSKNDLVSSSSKYTLIYIRRKSENVVGLYGELA